VKCPGPDKLSRYADGASPRPESAELARHLDGCDDCATRVEHEHQLSRALAVLPCPDPERLAAFIEEHLPPAELERIAEHVLACAPCQDVVTWTREGLQQLEAAPTRRRRRATIRPRQTTPAWLPAAIAAAAAACLLLVLILQDGPRVSQQAQTSPPPQVTGPGSPVTQPSAQPSQVATSPSPAQTAAPTPTPSAAPSTSPQPAAAQPRDRPRSLALALAGAQPQPQRLAAGDPDRSGPCPQRDPGCVAGRPDRLVARPGQRHAGPGALGRTCRRTDRRAR
jgi:hypothetical protein